MPEEHAPSNSDDVPTHDGKNRGVDHLQTTGQRAVENDYDTANNVILRHGPSRDRKSRVSRYVSRRVTQAWRDRKKKVYGCCTRCFLCVALLLLVVGSLALAVTMYFTVALSDPLCESNPCRYNGTCAEVQGEVTCTCPPGTTGVWCQTDEDDCQSDPCNLGGTCFDRVNDFLCNCPSGYGGKTCSVPLDECVESPCERDGTCVIDSSTNTFICVCPVGYTGRVCEDDIDECTSDPCVNGGTCEDDVNGYRCHCAARYTGESCQSSVTT